MSPGFDMATALKITTVGNSAGIVLPREFLSHMNVEKGDTLYVTKTPDGIQLVPYEESFAAQMEAAREVMRENRDVLRKLAE
jgi:putative addiction module antidote